MLPPGSSASDQLVALGYKLYIGEPYSDQYGKLGQISDPSKGVEWKGQANYDFVAETLMRVIQERMVNEQGL